MGTCHNEYLSVYFKCTYICVYINNFLNYFFIVQDYNLFKYLLHIMPIIITMKHFQDVICRKLANRLTVIFLGFYQNDLN